MTVTTETSRVDYTGNGVTVTFSVPFPFIQEDYLYVLRTNLTTLTATALILNSGGADGFTVTGAGGASGSITVVTAPTSNERLSIIREVPATQDADFVANDPFPAETFESALDKLAMICSQLLTSISRALTLSPSDSTAPGEVGTYNANGNRIIGLGDAVNLTDAVNLQQVDALVQGVETTKRQAAFYFNCPASPDASYDIDFGFTPTAVQIVAVLNSATIASTSIAYFDDFILSGSVVSSATDGVNSTSSLAPAVSGTTYAWLVADAGGSTISEATLVGFNASGITVNITTADPNVSIQCMAFR